MISVLLLSVMLTSPMWEDSNLEGRFGSLRKIITCINTSKILEYKGNSSDHNLADNITQVKFPRTF